MPRTAKLRELAASRQAQGPLHRESSAVARVIEPAITPCCGLSMTTGRGLLRSRLGGCHHFHSPRSSELTTQSTGQRFCDSSTMVEAARSAMSLIDWSVGAGDMRAQDDVRKPEKRAIRVRRLFAHDVQSGAGQVARSQGVAEVGFHDQARLGRC